MPPLPVSLCLGPPTTEEGRFNPQSKYTGLIESFVGSECLPKNPPKDELWPPPPVPPQSLLLLLSPLDYQWVSLPLSPEHPLTGSPPLVVLWSPIHTPLPPPGDVHWQWERIR